MEFQKSVHQAMATATTKLAEVQRQTMLRHQVTQRIEQMPSVSTPAKPATPKTPSVGTPKADSLLKRKKKSASDATSGQTGSAQKRRKKTPSMVSPKIA
ncbi:hypothetical protein H4R34_005703 [Dimargaris verticillata]|uniref:Uncharacterized protein n=1 Tax=Dimargaris verticillata TaxID=2761393 RepID=A0A9W8EAH3_9FUNG|nr:hypothetical protein H4R34_005703 [Dimargaris verticillata]